MLRFNNGLIRVNGNLATVGYVPPEPPTPSVPSDMDFIYLANDFDGSQIPNKATGSNAFGPYLQMGTLTKNGSGSNCYLSNGLSSSNYLYYDLTTAQRDAMYGNNDNTYTFFIRAYNRSSGTGGLFSWRANGGYQYMIRSSGQYLQLHTSYGANTSFSLDSDQVYKVYVDDSTLRAVKLSTGEITGVAISTKSMGTRMTSFWAGYGSEAYMDRIYSLAGIPRATTAEEDEIIKTALLNQSL
jgi:hypothetical protein